MDDAEVAATGMTPEDDLLAARADAAAFARLYEAYRLPVYRYLRSRSSTDDDAADLTAMTFERIFRGLSGYRPQGSPIGWILRIARNTAIDASRRRRPRRISLEGAQADQQSASDLSPEDTYLYAERATELRDRVHRLPEAQRDAISLRYASGLTAREIAGVIGKSEAATQKLLTRALVALKEAYDVQS